MTLVIFTNLWVIPFMFISNDVMEFDLEYGVLLPLERYAVSD